MQPDLYHALRIEVSAGNTLVHDLKEGQCGLGLSTWLEALGRHLAPRSKQAKWAVPSSKTLFATAFRLGELACRHSSRRQIGSWNRASRPTALDFRFHRRERAFQEWRHRQSSESIGILQYWFMTVVDMARIECTQSIVR